MDSTDKYTDFLEEISESLLVRSKSESFADLSGEEWEEIVFQECLNINHKNGHGWGITKTKATEFPDIVINEIFGIEVKSTKDDHWSTLGNSISESKRVPTVESVYFFFGKLGGKFEISFRPYEKCLKNIATTHYPRYIVDMKLADGLAIFDKLGITYDNYRQLSVEDRIQFIKKFLRDSFKDGESLWWIDDTTSPVIRNFNKLDIATKRDFKIMAMARCPEIFKGKRERGKYDRVAQLLLTEHQAVSGNLRDHFSASGRVQIRLLDDHTIAVPQMIYQLHAHAKQIKRAFTNIPDTEILHYWGLNSVPEDRVVAYRAILNRHGAFRSRGLGTGDFFFDGLSA